MALWQEAHQHETLQGLGGLLGIICLHTLLFTGLHSARHNIDGFVVVNVKYGHRADQERNISVRVELGTMELEYRAPGHHFLQGNIVP